MILDKTPPASTGEVCDEPSTAARYHRDRRAAARVAGDPQDLGFRAYRAFIAVVGVSRD